MKSFQIKLLLISFLLLLGKSTFDIQFFSEFFNHFNSNKDLTRLLIYTSIIGLLITITFNFLQRTLLYRVPITFTYVILFGTLILYQIDNFFFYDKRIDFIIASLGISSNLLIILTQKGILSRLTNTQNKIAEKSINIGNSAGLALSALLLLYLSDLIGEIIGKDGVLYFSISSLFLSSILIIRYLNRNKEVNHLQDNLQTIKVSQRFYKLIFQKYFLAIILLMTLAISAISLSYSFFIKINSIRYTSSNELANLLSILILVYAIISISYEFLFKDRLTYILNMKVNLQLLTIVIILFSTIFLFNSLLLNINAQHEFFFFISIFAILFIIFTQFIFLNIFYPAINRLYLPIENNTSNDFYIKSSFYGIYSGMGLSAIISAYILPEIVLRNDGNFILGNIGLVLILFPIIRYLVYPNYKNALHSKLHKESQLDFQQESFINNINSQLHKFKGASLIRIINLVQLINPIIAKKLLKKLANTDDTVPQRIGIIGAIKYYLLSIYEDMKSISKTKYYASSQNRDKIEQLITKFNEVEIKMQKSNYISQLSISKKENERIHSSLIVEHAPKNEQDEIIYRLINDKSSIVVKNAIIAAETINNKSIIISAIKRLGDDRTANAAFATLTNTGSEYIDLMNEAFNSTGQKEQIQIRIIQVMGRIASEKSIDVLLKKINQTNQTIVSEALKALSNCNIELPNNKKYTILEELEETCKQIVWNTSYIIDLKNFGASQKLLNAMDNELKENYIKMYSLLSLLYNPGSVDLIRKNLYSGMSDKISFALELATVVLKDEIKPMIIPLLRPIGFDQRIKKMKSIFVTESLEFETLLYDIIQRDAKWANGWTKACAILELGKQINKSHNNILLANIVNPDPLIAELSASVLRNQDIKAYRKTLKNIKQNLITIIGNKSFEIIDLKESSNRRMPILKYEIIEYFQKIGVFKNIPGEILKHITNSIDTIELETNDTIYKAHDYEIQPFFFIVYEGEVELKINGKTVDSYSNNSFINSLDFFIDYNTEIELKARTNAKIYKFDTFEFISFLNLYDIIPYSIINNTSAQITSKNNRLLLDEKNYKLNTKQKTETIEG